MSFWGYQAYVATRYKGYSQFRVEAQCVNLRWDDLKTRYDDCGELRSKPTSAKVAKNTGKSLGWSMMLKWSGKPLSQRWNFRQQTSTSLNLRKIVNTGVNRRPVYWLTRTKKAKGFGNVCSAESRTAVFLSWLPRSKPDPVRSLVRIWRDPID